MDILVKQKRNTHDLEKECAKFESMAILLNKDTTSLTIIMNTSIGSFPKKCKEEEMVHQL